MKAIIIDEKDVPALLDQLNLTKFQEQQYQHGKVVQLMEQYGITKQDVGVLVDELHRRFHYVVCRWFQEQGANAVRLT